MKPSAFNTHRQTGLVITRYGATLIVEDATQKHHHCTTRRHLDYAVCGDKVNWQLAPSGTGIVTAILPRRNELTRTTKQGLTRAIAANFDQLGVITACTPQPDWTTVDRYLAAAMYLSCEAFLVINKRDLQDNNATVAPIPEEYRTIGYTVLHTSARQSLGMDKLEVQLKDKITIFVGQSGVGKSSLVKKIIPNQDIRIGKLSGNCDMGRHTTSNTTLYRLPGGGGLIDSPGVRSFNPPPIRSHTTLSHGYIEFSPYLGHCRFHNCSHTVEPGCALIKAAEAGEISPKRLQRYQRLAKSLN